ncbi:MAG: hypothetical protein HOP15_04125, partial [Planctomycetes bacterium]|nr:hypothetical protein [Planctomycetota bacterium]
MSAALLGSLFLFALPPAALPIQESCGVCHGDVGLDERGAAHAAAGIGCVDCHGGQAGVLELPQAHGTGVHVPRRPRAQVELCGGCHSDQERMRGWGLRTDQLLLFGTSAHGQRLAEADDAEVATCVSCHGAHGVLKASDPRSPVHPFRQTETCSRCHADAALAARHELRADATALYRESVHGRALLEEGSLAAPACTGCHGSHGATPPRVDEVGHVCGGCHTAVQERFEQGPHLAAARDGLLEECVSCHDSHAVRAPSIEMLVGDGAGHCGSCHARDPEATAVGAGLHETLSGFDARLRATEEALAGASRRGIFVEPESDMLREARALRRRAGPLVHALSVQALNDMLERGDGMLAETREGIENRSRELRDRKVFVV